MPENPLGYCPRGRLRLFAMIFFTSDTHFGHENIIRFCKRPFADAKEMNTVLREKWNAKVGPLDTVYHLGDFALGPDSKDIAAAAWNLNGNIHLIKGNHEDVALNQFPDRFKSIQDYLELKVSSSQRVVLFHYPLRTWHHVYQGVWHLYGHVHGGLESYGKSFDIGVDNWNFEPLSLDEVAERMSKQAAKIPERGFAGLPPLKAVE